MATSAVLAEQMEFTQLDPESCARIRRLKPMIERNLSAALDRFYGRVLATPELTKFYADAAQVGEAKDKQFGHWREIVSADFDDRYVEHARAVGLAHARVGLAPRWYIGGYSLVLDSLIQSLVRELWPKALLRRGTSRAADEAGTVLGALVKAVLLDLEVAISVYIGAAEAERAEKQAEVDAEAEARASAVELIGAGLAKLAQKDLSYRMKETIPEAYRKLQNDFNGAIEQLANAFAGVDQCVETVQSGMRGITAAATDLSRRTEQQVSSLEETAVALGEITARVRQTAEGAKQAREVVSVAHDNATGGGAIVNRAVEAMGKIEKSSQQISQIIGVIDEIAFQTNLLALNAGVEAARAGDSGRGFAVVASEVRALAQRSAEAAKEIKALISTSAAQVGEGVQLVAQTGKALERIEAKVSEINGVVADIAASAQEQAAGLQQINAAVSQMDQATQLNAAMSEQARASGQSLAQECDRLTQLIGQFQVGKGADDPIRRELERVAPHAFPERAKPPSAGGSFGAVAATPPRAKRPVVAKTLADAPVRRAAQAEDADEGWKEF